MDFVGVFRFFLFVFNNLDGYPHLLDRKSFKYNVCDCVPDGRDVCANYQVTINDDGDDDNEPRVHYTVVPLVFSPSGHEEMSL